MSNDNTALALNPARSRFDTEFRRRLVQRLSTELNDAATADTEVSYLMDVFFTRTPAAIEASAVGSILAFSFSNRNAAVGGSAMPLPGPVNEKIADAAYSLHRRRRVNIYAQWEVASILASKYHMPGSALFSVSPPVQGANGKFTIPTPEAVVAAVLALAGSASLGTVAVVTQRDLGKRAVMACTQRGLAAGLVQGNTLPLDYDPEAATPANRRRDLFLLNDMANQFGVLRASLIAQEYPNG